MVDSINDKKKKVGGVSKTNKLNDIRKTDAIDSLKATSQVGSVNTQGIGNRKPTREMTLAERDAMLALVKQEAESMFANTNLSKEQTEAIELAVLQTLDASVITSDEEEEDNDCD